MDIDEQIVESFISEQEESHDNNRVPLGINKQNFTLEKIIIFLQEKGFY